MSQESVVIVAGARTPMGGLQGELAEMTAPQLGSTAIAAAVERGGVAAGDIDEVFMGCVLPAGQGQAPARQAAIGAGIPVSTGAVTVNKMCASAMQATICGHDSILAGTNRIVVAGGMESMTNAPHLIPNARGGVRTGHKQILDHMFLDGLTRAQQAIDEGKLKAETAPVTVKTRKGEVTVVDDEQPHKANLEKIPQLRPAFAKDGTITAANASSISDGASALLLMAASEAEARGIAPMARIVAHARHSQEPSEFTIAPIGAIAKVLEKTGWDKDEVDLYEINEAFAMVTMLAEQELGLDHAKVNVHGGACAQGHPIGSTGARIIVSLMYALKEYGKQKGVAALCIGGGEATAVAIELL